MRVGGSSVPRLQLRRGGGKKEEGEKMGKEIYEEMRKVERHAAEYGGLVWWMRVVLSQKQ